MTPGEIILKKNTFPKYDRFMHPIRPYMRLPVRGSAPLGGQTGRYPCYLALGMTARGKG